MFGITTIGCVCVLWIFVINTSSGEPCANNVEIKQNGTGHYLTWSQLGEGCGPFWFRSGAAKNEIVDTVLTSSPMLIKIRGMSSLICNGDCTFVRDLTVTKVTTTVSTKNTNCSPASRGTEGYSSTVVVAVAVVCSVVVLGLVVVIIVLMVKLRRTHLKQETVHVVNNGRPLRGKDINHIVNLDGPENEEGVYSEIGPLNNPQGPSTDWNQPL